MFTSNVYLRSWQTLMIAGKQNIVFFCWFIPHLMTTNITHACLFKFEFASDSHYMSKQSANGEMGTNMK